MLEQVAVRCRPLNAKEKQKQSQKAVKLLDEKIIILQDISAARPEEVVWVWMMLLGVPVGSTEGEDLRIRLCL